MIDKKLKEYRTYQSFNKKLLTFCGCWHASTNSGKLMYCWSVSVVLMMITYVMINVIGTYKLRHNFFPMMHNFSLALSSTGTMIKVSIFLANRKSLINYNQTLNDIFEKDLLRNEKIRTKILSSLRNISSIAYIYALSLQLMFAGYYLPTFLFIIRGLSHFNLTTDYALPVSNGYGYLWTVPKNFLYHFHSFFEMILAILGTFIAISVDNAFGYYVYQIASILRAMAFRITNLLPTDNYSNVLKACVEKHQILLSCRKTLEKIYGPIIFWHYITNAILLCALIYQAFLMQAQSKINVYTILALTSYCVIKLLQTFTYTWYGTVLSNASENFRMAVYFSNWPQSKLDRHMRANIILVTMLKSLIINAFYAPVNVVMFTNFVNSTMSYFFLLRSVRNE